MNCRVMGSSHLLESSYQLFSHLLIIGKEENDMLNQSKAAIIILAVTGFARVCIFAIPVVGVYLGVNSDTNEQINNK